MFTLAPLLLCAVVLLPCKAQVQDIPCFITPLMNGSVHSSLPEFNYSGCELKWMDMDLITLAVEEIELENVNLSNKSFITEGCKETIISTTDCFARKIHLKANCTTSCVGNPESKQPKGTLHTYWFFLILAAPVLAFVLYFIHTRRRNREGMV